MELFEVIILAVVQGLTEFLPISSSGHLVAARLVFGIEGTEGSVFDAFLHMGTLLAVLVYFRSVWRGMLVGIVSNNVEGRDKRELAAKLAVATVPAAVIGYLGMESMGLVWSSPKLVAGGLLVTALALMLVDLVARRQTTLQRASFLDAVIIGMAQAAALFPGISRSGVTMAAGRARGLSREQAVKFSFLLSAPIIAGAGLASLNSLLVNGEVGWAYLLIGLAVSFLFGLAAIFALLKVVEKLSFWPFVVYLLGLASWLFIKG